MKDIHFWEDALDKAFKKLNRLDKKVADKIKNIDKSKEKRNKKNVKFFTNLKNGFAKKHKSIKENNIPYILDMIEKLSK